MRLDRLDDQFRSLLRIHCILKGSTETGHDDRLIGRLCSIISRLSSRIGGLTLGGLPEGEWRALDASDLELLFRSGD